MKDFKKIILEVLNSSIFSNIEKYKKWCDEKNIELEKLYDKGTKEFKSNAHYVDKDDCMKKFSNGDDVLYNELKEFFGK